jgi:recombinational DNA repair protein RecT
MANQQTQEQPKEQPQESRLALIRTMCMGDAASGIEPISGVFPRTQQLAMEQFMRACQLELRAAGARSPAFWQTTKASLRSAIYQAASEALLPGLDGWFVPFGKAVVWMRNHKGVMKLVRRSGTVDDDVKVQAVMQGDHFVYRETADGTVFEWEAAPQRGPGVVGVWLRAFPKGSPRALIVYLPWAEIDKRRQASIKRNKKETPSWQQWPVEMAMKTVILYAVNRGMLPLNTEIQDVMAKVMREEWGSAYDDTPEPRYAAPRRASEPIIDAEYEDPEAGDEDDAEGAGGDEEVSPLEQYDLSGPDFEIINRARDQFGVDVEACAVAAGGDKRKFINAVTAAARVAQGGGR